MSMLQWLLLTRYTLLCSFLYREVCWGCSSLVEDGSWWMGYRGVARIGLDFVPKIWRLFGKRAGDNMNNWPPNAHYAPHACDHTLPTRLACRCLGGLCGLEVFLCDLIGDPLANSIHQHGHQRSSNSIANNNRVIESRRPTLDFLIKESACLLIFQIFLNRKKRTCSFTFLFYFWN